MLTLVYCKRGYFRWGKISQKCWQDVSRGGNFHDSTTISVIKAYGFYFRLGVIFVKKTKARKMRKLSPRENFNVYSSCLTKLSRRLATVEANLCSPASSEIRKLYSGAFTWLDRCVRPVNTTKHDCQFKTGDTKCVKYLLDINWRH